MNPSLELPSRESTKFDQHGVYEINCRSLSPAIRKAAPIVRWGGFSSSAFIESEV
jgi:hypothetical protein